VIAALGLAVVAVGGASPVNSICEIRIHNHLLRVLAHVLNNARGHDNSHIHEREHCQRISAVDISRTRTHCPGGASPASQARMALR
jgi:hypothetical protein